jgi:hypothetical protein
MARFDLLTTLSMQTLGFEQGIDRAKRSTQGFQNVIKGMGSFLAPVIGVTSALGLLKSSINAVEGAGDDFEAVMGGGKEALFEFQRALGTMDFSGLIENLKDAYKRGKEFAELMDDLKDRTAYSDYLTLGWEQEAEALREIAKNKTLEISVRADAAEKIKELELKVFNRRKELIQDTYDIEKMSWEGRQKMTIEEGKKLYEIYDKITEEGYNDVTAETVKQIEDLFNKTVKTYQIAGSSFSKSVENAGKLVRANLAGFGNYDFIKNVPKEDLAEIVNILSEFSTVNTTGEADVWVKLFGVINKQAKDVSDAQVQYNGAIAETTKLLAQEEKAENKITAEKEKQLAAQELINAKKANTPIAQAATAQIAIPTVAPVIDKLTLAVRKPAEVFVESWQDAWDKIGIVTDGIANAFVSLGEVIQQASEDGKISFAEAMGIIQQTAMSAISILGALAAAQMISKEASKGLVGIFTAVAGLAALAGLWAAFVKPKPMAAGGIVYGNSLVNVGEYPSARNNPEVIAPLDKLRNLIGGVGGGEVTFRIQGDTLVGVLNNYNRKVNSYR